MSLRRGADAGNGEATYGQGVLGDREWPRAAMAMMAAWWLAMRRALTRHVLIVDGLLAVALGVAAAAGSLLRDPRIPRRDQEPGLDASLPVGSYEPAWLREGLRYWLRTMLTHQAICWGTARSYAAYLGRVFGGFACRQGITNPALVDEPERQLRPLVLGYLEELRSRPSEATKRVMTPTTRNIAQVVLSNFYRFAYDHRFELAETTGDERWTRVSVHHTRLWPEEFATRRNQTLSGPRRTAPTDPAYIGDADLSRMVAGVELLGLPKDQTREVVVNGQRARAHGLGDPQSMRAWLIQALTGRRANEILKLSFHPYELLDGLDLEQAGEDDFIARFTYAQTKVEGVDPTILVEQAVVNIIQEQQRWLRDRLGEAGRAGEPEFLFITTARNHRGRLPRSLVAYHGALGRLDRLLRLTDSNGQPLRYVNTHRLRHTKATALLNNGVAVHVVQRYMGHRSPEMTLRYGATLAKTAEAEFLRYKKVGRDGRDLAISPRDLYELAELDRRTDRVLPNGLCMLPPTKKCERGNACLPCDFFATDRTHLGELRHQQAATLTLIGQRRRQHLERTGTPMTDDNVWLRGRTTELRSLAAIIARLEADDVAQAPEPIAVRGAGVSGRPGCQDQPTITPETTPDAVRRSLHQHHPEAQDGIP